VGRTEAALKDLAQATGQVPRFVKARLREKKGYGSPFNSFLQISMVDHYHF